MSLSDISIKFTDEVLNEIVQNAGGSKVLSWRFGEGFKRGESYLSETYRLIIDAEKDDGTKCEIRTVVKSLPQNIGRRKTFRSDEFFEIEYIFFNHFIPKYQEFQAKKNIGDTAFTEYPRCYKAYSDGEHDFIALEDLQVYNYVSVNRQRSLDFEHCKLIMQTLGKFHAVSLAIRDQQPDEFQKLLNLATEIYYAERYRKWYSSYMKLQIQVAQDAIHREYPDTIYEQKAFEFTDDKFFDRMINYTHRNGPYSVFGHGDCWIMNFLMQYVNNVPINSKIIDFQLLRYGSAALDISFFFYSCTTQDLREAYYDELLKIYHKAVADLLTALGSDPDKVFPYSAFLNEMKEYACFGLGISMEAIPLSIMDDVDLFDLDSIKDDNGVPMGEVWKIKNIQSQEGRRRLADIFKHAVDCGYFD